MATISRETYRRKVYGCWLGKTVGGTLGQPHEGKMQVLDLDFYDPVPTGAIANDDLDLQLVWLAALRAVGPRTDERVLGDWWRRSLVYPFDEYGIAKWNLGRGIEPPVSGQFANEFGHCMGAPIRSEIWACIAPGCPALAAEYAYCDGCVDHGGEGIYGEVFFAALEAAAFVVEDRDQLLDIGLSFLPPDCRTAGAVRLIRALHAEGKDWLAAREAILAEYHHDNFCDAPQNIAFTVLGWLYGSDAGDMMCKAVNCGYDTDCTGATLGAILGLIHGPEIFAERWVAPVGDEVVVGWGVVDCECPSSLQELSAWTEEIADQVTAHHASAITLGETTDVAAADLQLASYDLAARWANHAWTLRLDGAPALWLDYGGAPALAPGEARTITVTPADSALPDLACEAPAGWQVAPAGPGRFALTAAADILAQPSWELTLRRTDGAASWPFVIAPAVCWQVSGPVAVEDAAAALANPPETGDWRPIWTPDHRLVLAERVDRPTVCRVKLRLALPEARDARLISATPELQRVWLDGNEVIEKAQPTRFIPAPHRSGAGTVVDVKPWPAGDRLVEILLVANAGAALMTHVFLTRPREIDGPRMVPWEDQVLRPA